MYRDFEYRLHIDCCSWPPFVISLCLLEDTEYFLAQTFKIKHAAMGNHIFIMGMGSWFCLIQQRFLSEFQPQGNIFLSNAVIKVA